MRQFLIYFLGGMTNEDHERARNQYCDEINELRNNYHDARNLLISEHDEAMRHASVQLQQLQEMLRQKEVECEGIERGRIAINDAYHDASERLRLTSEQCTKLRDDNAAILAQAERNIKAAGALKTKFEEAEAKLGTMSIELRNLREACTNIEDERDILKAKLSRPKKPKPAKVEV